MGYKVKHIYCGTNLVRPSVPATAISLNKSSISLATVGQTSQLTATLTPSGATSSVSWSSSNTSIATVSSSGLVTCVTPGSCTITATTDNGLTASCSVIYWNGDLSKASSSNRKSATVSRSGGYGYVGIFSSDGTIYTVQYGEAGYTDQYRLSTAWDITTIGSSFYSMSKQGSTSYSGGCFGNDGRIFLTRSTYGTFIKYTLSTPRLLSTRDSGTSMTIGDVSNAATQYCFSEDGTKFIYSNDSNKKLEQSRNTAWSVTGTGTVILTGTNLSRGTFDTYGDYFYLMYNNGTIKKYKLPNKYDLTGMTEQQSISLSIGACSGLAFDTLGNNMYILVQGYGTQTIYQYTLT